MVGDDELNNGDDELNNGDDELNNDDDELNNDDDELNNGDNELNNGDEELNNGDDHLLATLTADITEIITMIPTPLRTMVQRCSENRPASNALIPLPSFSCSLSLLSSLWSFLVPDLILAALKP